MPGRVLLTLLFPGHVLFIFIIFLVKIEDIPSVLFVAFYLIAALIQVSFLLYICHLMVYWMWSRGTDPDNAAIPYLTAIGDLVGTTLLAVAFFTLQEMGDQSLKNLPEHGHHSNTTHPDNSTGNSTTEAMITTTVTTILEALE